MINLFLGVALVAAPFFIKAGIQSSAQLSQEYFLGLVTMLGVLLFGIKKTHLNIKIIATSLFVLAFLPENPFGLFQMYQLAFCVVGALFIALIYSEAENINIGHIKELFSVVCIVESLWIILQYFGFDIHAFFFSLIGTEVKTTGKVFGSLGNINHSAALVACLMPFLRVRHWIVPTVALYLGNSTMPVICAFVGALSLYSYRRKNFTSLIYGAIALFFSALALIAGVFDKRSFFSDSGRLEAWTKVLNETGFQILGKGLGYIPEVFSKTPLNGEKFYQLHNEWIELYVIGGLLSVVVALYLITPIFKNKHNPEINACLIALLVNSLGNFTFHIAPLFMVFGVCYGLQLSKE